MRLLSEKPVGAFGDTGSSQREKNVGLGKENENKSYSDTLRYFGRVQPDM